MFAVMKIGAVLVPINTRFRSEDIAYVPGQSAPDAHHRRALRSRGLPGAWCARLAPSLPRRPLPASRASRTCGGWSRPGDEPRPRSRLGAGPRCSRRGARVAAAALAERADARRPRGTAFLMLHLGHHRVPEGRDARPRDRPQRGGPAFRMAITPADVILMYLPLFHLFGFSRGRRSCRWPRGRARSSPRPSTPRQSLDLIDRERVDDPPRLRHAFQGAAGGARARAPRRVERPHRDLRGRHVELHAHRADARARCSARSSPATG